MASDRSTVHQAARDLYVNAEPVPSPGFATLVVPEEVTHPVRGRDDLLASLRASVELGGQVVVLHGNGGHGKTTVAVQFARQVGVEVWWVDASSATNVTEGLREVALRAGADDRAVRNAWTGASSAPEVLWRALDARVRPWLLVLDNADDPRVLAPDGSRVAAGRGWLRTPKSTGTILITSRDGRRSEWGDRAFAPVDVLAVEDAARVLLDLAPDAGREPDAHDLAERLGCLPLGLRLAGHYLRSTSQAVRLPGVVRPRTFAEYGQALADGAELRERETLAGTWELSLDLLAKRGQPLARPLLRLLSTFAPAPVPVELLDASVLAGSEQFADITPRQLADLVEGLRGLGLVDHQSNALVLHPLVRDAGLRHAAGYDDLRAAMLTQVAVSSDMVDPRTWPLWRALLPHCLALDRSTLLIDVAAARFCASVGSEADAEHLVRRALAESSARLGDDDALTLGLRFTLSTMAGRRGEDEVAEAELRAVLAAQLRTLEPDHPDVLSTRLALRLTRNGRDFAPTDAELRAVVADRTRSLGPDHAETLSARDDLAWELSEQGRHAEALAEYRALLELRRARSGDEHPSTLDARAGIAAALFRAGDAEGAAAERRALLVIRERVLGSDHPDTLSTRYLLAGQARASGHLEVAERELSEILALRERVLGTDHRDTAATRKALDRVREERASPSP
ncbi:tetratricopeptide repeat protein [Actinosynnema sp. NPDC051121]|nr:tetratricopeptide repeat protein [Saccharothrix sp.]